MRKKRVSPELSTFWEEIGKFGRNLVPVAPELPRTPEELSTRAHRAVNMTMAANARWRKVKTAGNPTRRSKT
jgi:hypothetical protein